MKQLIIIGAGGLGREIADLLRECKEWSTGELGFKGFLDDNPSALSCDGKYKMLGCLKNYRPKPTDVFICAIGNPEIREKIINILKENGWHLFTFIHKTAIISDTAGIGEGCIIKPYAIIGSHAEVGKGCIIQPHATIEHDVKISEYCLIGANSVLQGGSQIGSLYEVRPCTCVPRQTHVGKDGSHPVRQS